MVTSERNRALQQAVAAARAAGAVLRANLRAPKTVHATTAHDVKLELDVRCQRLIGQRLRRAFPDVELLGEEGAHDPKPSAHRWVVDPIDGTVNFTHGIPHACVCIALQERSRARDARVDGGYRTLIGVVYDPFLDELWTGVRGGPARLNGRAIHVSRTARLSQSVVSMGFGKSEQHVRQSLRLFHQLSLKARKVRNMGAAGLAMVYVATGRFDVYIEQGISLWDIAAGGLIVECAGGEFWREPLAEPLKYRMIASNGRLRAAVARL
jgi:myo-inositol-1(or 4)-monophosphatase